MRDMRVSSWPIYRLAGSLEYLAGGWREATPHCIVICLGLIIGYN